MSTIDPRVIAAVDAVDQASAVLSDKLHAFIENSGKTLSGREEFILSVAMTKLRETRALFMVAAGMAPELPEAYGLQEVKQVFEDLHATIESTIQESVPVENLQSQEDLEVNLATRAVAFNTLDQAEIAAICSLLHFTTLAEFLSTHKSMRDHEIKAV